MCLGSGCIHWLVSRAWNIRAVSFWLIKCLIVMFFSRRHCLTIIFKENAHGLCDNRWMSLFCVCVSFGIDECVQYSMSSPPTHSKTPTNCVRQTRGLSITLWLSNSERDRHIISVILNWQTQAWKHIHRQHRNISNSQPPTLLNGSQKEGNPLEQSIFWSFFLERKNWHDKI